MEVVVLIEIRIANVRLGPLADICLPPSGTYTPAKVGLKAIAAHERSTR